MKSVFGIIETSPLQSVVNQPKTIPAGIWSRIIGWNFLRRSISCTSTKNECITIVPSPISNPVHSSTAYGRVLSGETPRSEMTENAMPAVMIKSPRKYIVSLFGRFLPIVLPARLWRPSLLRSSVRRLRFFMSSFSIRISQLSFQHISMRLSAVRQR